ncbi:MAG TPA: hypothetical protein VHD36_01430 [Pirellulales bacterium]|nr:hypothetical protein [Pirellulales bacterium]
MKMNRSSVVVEYRLVASYEEVRKKLLTEEFADRLDKPLAFWALPTDRSSPIALMGKTLRELFSMPFEQLFATPGIGQKKINCLIELLRRAANPNPPGSLDTTVAEEPALAIDGSHVDATQVSEALWVQWQQTVRDHGLGNMTLGRVAPSLERLPRVIWNTPLDAYTSLSLAQIRSLKTHGEKRVSAVLEVFGSLHALLAGSKSQPHLSVQVVPRFVADIEYWASAVMRRTVEVDAASIRRSFVDRLMAQVEIDAGEEIAQLAASRLQLDGSGATVRQVARDMDLTRARVYQLLGDIAAVMNVRWPDAQVVILGLREALREQIKDTKQLGLFDAVCDLFFPNKQHDGLEIHESHAIKLPDEVHAE